MKPILRCLIVFFCSCKVFGAELPRTTSIDPLELNTRTPQHLNGKKARQLRAIENSPAFHDFAFVDRRNESGITFKHTAVDDAAKYWQPAHYDHGSGIAAADVDQDGKIDLFFANQIGGSQLWRNLGGGRFTNITERAGVGLPDRFAVAAAFADVDNDGLPDLFVTTVRSGNALFRNEGGGRFRDITKEAGLSYHGHSSGIVFFDFNRDGLLDLFVVNVGKYTHDERGNGGFYRAYAKAFAAHLEPARSESSLIYENLGNGRFKNVSKEMNLERQGWNGDASACDLNEDGFPDLYVVNMQGDDQFYENQNGKGFVEKAASYFPKTPWGAMGIKFFDYNRDGRSDLYITDMHSDMTERQTEDGKRDFSPGFETRKSEPWCSIEWSDAFLQGASNNIFGNAFYEQQGDGFVEVSDKVGLETYWPWGPSVGDLNADGYDDVFVTAGMGYPFRYGHNYLLLNEAGDRFTPAEFALGIEPRQAGIEIEYFTLDCDGKDKSHIYCRDKNGILSIIGSTSARSSVMLDLDADGDLDIVTNEMNDAPQVLISNLTERKKVNFLQVKLVGSKSNRDGLGAKVTVTTSDGAITQWNDGKSGYLAQSSIPLYFGLGDSPELRQVEVMWPSGRKQTVTKDLKSNTLLAITEADRRE